MTVKLIRYENNPILLPTGNTADFDGAAAFNAAAIQHEGKVHLIYRGDGICPRTPGSSAWLSTIGHAVSEDGFTVTERSSVSVIDDKESPELLHILGVQEPSIVKIGDEFNIVYAIYSDCYERLALAVTKDFKSFEKRGMMEKYIAIQYGTLFPEKINGRYMMLNRLRPSLWISEGEDLMNWSQPELLLRNETLPWMYMQIIACAPPIRTSRAWAVFFAAQDLNKVCRLGILWLDLENPKKLLKLQEEPILEPEAEYEINGLMPNQLCTCGCVVKGDEVIVYYGAAGTCLCAATVKLADIEL